MTDLRVENVELSLGAVPVLRGASFEGSRGEVVALLGASGSGKTTLLRSIAGLERPSKGRIVIGGKTVLDVERRLSLPPEQRDIGLVFQSYALWPHRTVAENVAFGLKLRGVAPAEIGRRVTEMLGRLGLGHLGERYPFQLSGGQQQRVAICRALVYEPRAILLDEPLSNLDAKLRDEARYFIRKLILDLELCAVIVTHDQSEALAMSDRVILLKDGAILQEGTPMEIYENPRNRYVAEFLGSNNLLHGQARAEADGSTSIHGADWQLTGQAQDGVSSEAAVAVVRVDKVRIVDGPGQNRVPVEIEASIYLGQHWEYRMALGGAPLRAFGPQSITAGPAWCEVPPESVWIFADRQP
ncbi:ABC transporter ATP-binding protein [Bosea sp. NBC_00550]|uniref:ABC transporter ATP-binding protein n=1 Tax=Bosea sp. NBC_00550 TaxID=2969621 RepID=UPI002230C440|nr:ABC transporter ATP-binding protein [Bosea sp. NBC_00550]UZF94937.1 ABC transporter ATP-binding protein [Bosea sp. NBC_00550]